MVREFAKDLHSHLASKREHYRDKLEAAADDKRADFWRGGLFALKELAGHKCEGGGHIDEIATRFLKEEAA